jgi:nocardicin N-oxygenase
MGKRCEKGQRDVQAIPIPAQWPNGIGVDPFYMAVQETAPLMRIRLPYGGDGWLVTRYEDVKKVISDPRFSRQIPWGEDLPRITAAARRDETIGGMDPPQHTRLRSLVTKAFTPRRVEMLRPRAQAIVNSCLDEFERSGPPADLVRHVALPMPMMMICEMLGTPIQDRKQFGYWTKVLVSSTAYSREELSRAVEEIQEYLAGLVALRRRSRHDDLLGDLVAARDEGDRLSEEELITFGVTLLVAGYETTANQIANSVYLLLENPDQLAKLRTDQTLLPRAVEELLRVVQLGGGVGRTRIATEDVALSSGTIAAGEAVFVAGGPANLDPRVFPDRDRLDVTREHCPHLSFGHGPHFCLGAQLARMQIHVALGSLLRRFPGLRLADADRIEWKTGLLMRGPENLCLAW